MFLPSEDLIQLVVHSAYKAMQADIERARALQVQHKLAGELERATALLQEVRSAQQEPKAEPVHTWAIEDGEA
jgi:maltooligosyltrehalose synthase